jgi:pilus assembly protein CpaC
MRHLFKRCSLAATLVLGLAAYGSIPAGAQVIETRILGGPGETIRLDGAGGERVRDITIARGKSVPVNFNASVRNTAVADPSVVDLLPMSPGQFILTAKAPGHTDIRFFDGNGKPILTMNIRVEMDTASLAATIARVVPKAQVRVEAIDSSIVLTGNADSISDADAAVQIARLAVAKPENVLNRITLAEKDQVMLKVRIVEVQRNIVKQFGVDLGALIGQIGSAQFAFSNAASFAVNGGLLGGLSGGYNLNTTQGVLPNGSTGTTTATNGFTTGVVTDAAGNPVVINGIAQTFQIPNSSSTVTTNSPNNTLASRYRTPASGLAGSTGFNQANSTIKAFERVGLLRTLAEPNLTAVSGESAKFLAGGEFPVPTALDSTGHVSVEFKPFGIGLGFTPVVLSGGRISLKMSTEVSELSTAGAFTIQGPTAASSLTIPALAVRRANTVVELPSGGSMMIGGLLGETTRQNIDKVPGLAEIPVLGALARSRDYLTGETEVVMIVTAYIVKPTEPGVLQTPADGLRVATDAQTLLLGKLNQAYGVPPAAVAGRTYEGAFGHVIE